MTFTKRRGIYYVTFQTESGTRRSVSTRATNLRDATTIARGAHVDKLEHAALAGRLTNEVIGQIKAGRKITVMDAIGHFCRWQKTVGKSDKTIYSSKSTLKRWAKRMKVSRLPPAAIEESHIGNWINSNSRKDKAASRDVSLSIIRSFIKYCSAKGWVAGNPASLVCVNRSHLPHELKENKVRHPVSHDEYLNLVEACRTIRNQNSRRFWRFAIIAGWELGFRLGDICRLQWGCFQGDNLIHWTDKNDRRIVLPVPAAIRDELTSLPVSNSTYLFPEEYKLNEDPTRRAYLSVQFRRLCEKAGIEGKTFHGLRHAFVARQRALGFSNKDIAPMVGHVSQATTEGYGN